MRFLSTRTAAALGAAAMLSACSYLGALRMPSMPSMPSWGTAAPKVQQKAVVAPAALQPTDRSETWQGIYRQQGETVRFTECRTRAEMPVAQGGDSALLESAYATSRPAPGAPLLVQVQGRWVQRARTDLPPSANASELVLLVERFVSVSSQTSCAGW